MSEVQLRWRNLRTSFARELSAQKQGRSGQGAVKRRKYVYYEQLQFLKTTLEERATTSDQALIQAENRQDNDSDASEAEEDNESQMSPAFAITNPIRRQRGKKETFEESLLNILAEKKEEIDEDKLFLLSLLPPLKKLNTRQKFEAKIDLLRFASKWESVALTPPAPDPQPSLCPHPLAMTHSQLNHQPKFNAESHSIMDSPGQHHVIIPCLGAERFLPNTSSPAIHGGKRKITTLSSMASSPDLY